MYTCRSAVGGGGPQSVARDARRHSSSCKAAVVTPFRRHTTLAALGGTHIMLQAPSRPRRSNSVLTYLRASGLDFASAAVAASMHFLCIRRAISLRIPRIMLMVPRGALHMHAKLCHPLIGCRFRSGERVSQQCDTHSLPEARCRLSCCQQLLLLPRPNSGSALARCQSTLPLNDRDCRHSCDSASGRSPQALGFF